MPLPVTTMMFNFDPNDPRWADQYRNCTSMNTISICDPTCQNFCTAVLKAGGGTPPSPGGYLRCVSTCGDANTLTITYSGPVCLLGA